MQVKIPWGPVGYIVYKRTYSRNINDIKTEEFPDTVERLLRGCQQQLKCNFSDSELQDIKNMMLELKGLPAGRFLWQLGTSTVKNLGLASLQNCSATVVNSPIRPFTWTMDMLMLGSGVGYNIQKEYVYELPKVKKVKIIRQDTKDADFIVPDSRAGWVKLLEYVLNSHFYTGENFSYSTMLIRGKGAAIKGFGGIASGPEELCYGIEQINNVLNCRAGKKLRPIDCLDIMNIIGYIVVAGNVRRSAQLALGDMDDLQYLNAKKWDLGSIPNWRSMSNNSIVCNDANQIPNQFWDGYCGNGEPYGLVNLALSRKIGRIGETQYCDPDIVAYNPCITGDTLIAVADGRNAVPIKDLVGTTYPVYTIKDNIVTISTSIKTWKTRKNAEIWELTLDDGSKLKATPDHLIMLRNGKYKKLKDLQPNESLMPFNSYKSRIYRQISTNNRSSIRQYRMIAKYHNIIVDPKTTHIHHKDFNSLNDAIDNLEVMDRDEHISLHAKRMRGENNPVNKMSKEEYREKYFRFFNNNGSNNPMYGKKHSKKILSLIGQKSIENWSTKREFMISKIKEGMKDPLVRKKISDIRKSKTEFVDFICPVCNKKMRLTKSQALKRKTCSNSCSKIKRYNHKVVSIKFIGYEDVYDMTVENTANFAVITSNKDDKYIESSGIFIHNCAEQSLEEGETCCLQEIFLPNISSPEELFSIAKNLYRIAKHSLALKCHHKDTEYVVHKNMRMGIGLTGILQCTNKIEWLDECYKKLREYDKEYSSKNDFPPSIKLTTVKPSGTLSLLAGTTSGIHPGYSQYYLRRIRIASNSPLTEIIKNHGYNIEYQRNFDNSIDRNTMVAEFPCSHPEGTILAKNLSAVDQLENIKLLQGVWSDNAVSCTIYYKKEELDSIKNWLLENYNNNIKTCSFLLHNEHGFNQAPLEEITEDQYIELKNKTKPIELVNFEDGDIVSEYEECLNGSCPVK